MDDPTGGFLLRTEL